MVDERFIAFIAVSSNEPSLLRLDMEICSVDCKSFFARMSRGEFNFTKLSVDCSYYYKLNLILPFFGTLGSLLDFEIMRGVVRLLLLWADSDELSIAAFSTRARTTVPNLVALLGSAK